MNKMNIKILLANYEDKQQSADIGFLLNYYAMDPMGGGQELDPYIVRNIGRELSNLPHAFSVLCYVDSQPAGLVNCFDSFSTFNCKPLVNIHDIVVVQKYRNLGLSQKMLEKVEEIANEKGCCKMTLEVLEGNKVARSAYEKYGFTSYVLDPEMGPRQVNKPMIKNKPNHINCEIKIKGRLENRWAEWFEGLAFTHESDGTTTLSGPLPDQAALHSILLKIRDMNLTLISVTRSEPNREE